MTALDAPDITAPHGAPNVDLHGILIRAYRGNFLRITEESVPDTLQKVLACQKNRHRNVASHRKQTSGSIL
jgi:hypothetical protein